MRNMLLCMVACLLASLAFAQDPVKVDPKHYKIEKENDQVRVLRVHYGPHEKSVMHEHPSSVATFLNAGRVKFTYPDGKAEERSWKAHDVMVTPAGTHLPENLTAKPFDLVLVELKGK
ncbi:MAG TPA: hypothetical protein VFA76_07645 [Terriglobales bacterium]|nr:hypothetical protein [Terriglobales bacterium]